MFTIIALGNPGKEYENTRHNSGRVIMDKVMQKWNFGKMVSSAKFGGMVAEGALHGVPLLVVYPDTYMNHSGRVVKKVVDEIGNGYTNLIVVYDEMAFPFGEFKFSMNGGAGGHNGLASVIDELGTKDFARMRIGIAPRNFFGTVVRPRGDKLSSYVLGKLTKNELKKLEETVDEVTKEIEKLFT